MISHHSNPTTTDYPGRISRLLPVLVILFGLIGCQPTNSQQTATLVQPAVAETIVDETNLLTTPQPTSTENSPTPSKLPESPTLSPLPTTGGFVGERAYEDVNYQVNLGPRTPGSDGHQKIRAWIVSELEKAGWQVEIQDTTYMNQPVINITARRESQNDPNKPWILLGAHYDTRFYADQDPDPGKRSDPVPGGNDGASGVAVLLELARTLPPELSANISLVFFDAEDNGSIPGWDWLYGSRAYAESLTELPDAVVIADMIGDADLNIYYEKNSDTAISAEIFSQAADLGYREQFIPEPRFRILDDHVPFIEREIRAVDLIDFDYPYYHTTEDTADKVSANSLEAVGITLWHWLQGDLASLAGNSP